MSTMIDEILIDANLFGTKGQNNLLIRIIRNPQVRTYFFLILSFHLLDDCSEN